MGNKKSKLKKLITKTDLMNISIVHGKDKIKFNLFEELVIDENKINEEITEQPSYFGYLSLLLNRLERVRDDKKAELTKVYSSLFIQYKGDTDDNTNRPLSNDLAEAKVYTSTKYQKAMTNYNTAVENHGTIKSCVDAFYQRSHLIQSLSANVRKEKSQY